MLSDPILEIPSDGFKGFRLGDDDEVDGGAGGVEEDGGDQPLEVVRQLCLISHLGGIVKGQQFNLS